MGGDLDWDELLRDHPVLSPSKSVARVKNELSLSLSLNSLRDFVNVDPSDDAPTPSGRHQTVAIKDTDIIVAAGTEVRIAPLGDAQGARSSTQKPYKILHTPDLKFEIRQIALNPNGKLLAVVGAFQVAVIVLPRSGFNKVVTATVDCKSIQVGQYHHSPDSTPIVKVEWHPWGQGGSTLLVMTSDGKLREYDISLDAEEPQQTLSFVPEKKKGSFYAEDASEREVASFCLGKGRADWGPLTVYALMRSGDVYAICPYMPKNASVSSSYVYALDCFVAAKREFLSNSGSRGESSSSSLSSLYDYQHKYVNALMKQLPSDSTWPSNARSVPMHPPKTIRNAPVRQGPFLLQPSPRMLEGSEGGDATDIVYLTFGNDALEESEGETERLGLVLVAFQDGKVDLYLDVEKVEARWQSKQGTNSKDLPMLAVYETIDLGIVSALTKANTSKAGQSLLDLIQANHPVFLPDPIHDDAVYVHHAFGVHVLHLGPLLTSLAAALREGGDDANSDSGSLESTLANATHTDVNPILLTFSVDQQSSSPVTGIAIPNDVYLTYSIFILTSSMRMSVFPLNLRYDTPISTPPELPSPSPNPKLNSSIKALPAPPTPNGPPAYVSLLTEPFTIPPAIARSSGLPSNARLSQPTPPSGEFMLTPETLRHIGSTVERFTQQIRDVQLAHCSAEVRAVLLQQEFARQRDKCRELLALLDNVRSRGGQDERLKRIQETQVALMARLDRVLQGMMAKASPELSESETKWFEELRRMKVEVAGAGKFDDRSLVARLKLLRREVDRLLPELQEMKGREAARLSHAQERERLGVSQAFEYGKRSTEERSRIEAMEKEILRLASRLDINVGRTPSQRGAQDGDTSQPQR